tara:strand:+ start:1116 stop:1454 length:339 start_codon:yes stop_codon:yes gene_type:complete
MPKFQKSKNYRMKPFPGFKSSPLNYDPDHPGVIENPEFVSSVSKRIGHKIGKISEKVGEFAKTPIGETIVKSVASSLVSKVGKKKETVKPMEIAGTFSQIDLSGRRKKSSSS